jgi:hypothetical protein
MGWKSAALALGFLLVGCNQDAQAPEEVAIEQQRAMGGAGADIVTTSTTSAMAPPSDGYADRDAQQDSPAPPAPPPAPQPAQGAPPQQTSGPAPILYLAYAYQTGLRIPGDRLIGVMDAHVQACQQAGPRLCQLVGSNRSGDPESYLSGSVQMRGEPSWLRTFMGGLERQADAAGGRIVSQSTSTEDLTRAIVDTEAQLRAKRALRDRLQRLLETRPGRLSDLLEAERALAQVQGEIDSVQSGLAVMRSRVSMSELTISYESSAEPLRSDLFEPLTEALANFAGWIVKGLAAIITAVAVLLPWAGLAALILWLTRGWRRTRRGWFWRCRAEAPPEPDA